MQWKMVLPAPHDGIGEQARSGETAINRQLGGGATDTTVSALRRRPLRTNLGRQTRTTTSEAGRRSTVSLTSWPMRSKASSPSRWTSSGRYLDLDAWQVLGQRLTAGRLLALVLADRLRRRCFVHHRPLPDQRRQHGHGQLRVIGAETFGLLAE